MQRVRLFGKGAVTFHHGKELIRSDNGHIDVPELLVSQALSMGFTRQPTGPFDDDVAKVAVPESVALTPGAPLTSAERAALYRKEAEEKGYDTEAVDQIVAERLRFDQLREDGMSEADALEAVWPSNAPVDTGVVANG